MILTMTYRFRNDHDALAALLDPALLDAMTDIQQLADEAVESVQNCQLPENFALRRAEIITRLFQVYAGGRVYRLKYLRPERCARLVELMRDSWGDFEPNPDEDPDYQMDEIVLSLKRPDAYELFSALHDQVLRRIWIVIFGVSPETINSIQVARYQPGPRAMTNWHYDRDSECTSVVELTSQSDRRGAGFEVFPGTAIPPAEQGEITLFQGSTLLHRSLPVTAGERAILVHWAGQ